MFIQFTWEEGEDSTWTLKYHHELPSQFALMIKL